MIIVAHNLHVLVLSGIGVLVYSHLLAWAGLASASDFVLITIFASSAVSSIAGFAFSAICGSVLFHSYMGQVSVVQTMMMCSIGSQAYMTVMLRRHIDWRALMPFLIGGVVGLPIGLTILLHTSRTVFVAMIGGLLCLYSLYMLFRRPIILPHAARICDGLIGFIGGITGGAAAMPSASIAVWGQMFGWERDYQRGIYQPFILIMQILAVACMLWIGTTASGGTTLLSASLAMPPALAGTMIGLRWYRNFSDRQFFVAVNLLLLFSGLTLLV
jgi:uncharacterized membrane protein YfcA